MIKRLSTPWIVAPLSLVGFGLAGADGPLVWMVLTNVAAVLCLVASSVIVTQAAKKGN